MIEDIMKFVLWVFVFFVLGINTNAQDHDSCTCYTYEVQLTGNLGALLGQDENFMIIHYDFYHLGRDSVVAIAYPISFNNNFTNSIEDIDTVVVLFNTTMYRSWEGEKSKHGGYKKYSVVHKGHNAFCKDADNLKMQSDTTAEGPVPPFLQSKYRITSISNENLKFIWKGCGDSCVLPLNLIHNLTGNTSSAKEEFLEFF